MNLTGHDLRIRDVNGYLMTSAELTFAICDRLRKSRGWSRDTVASITGADLRGCVLTGANLTEANLTDAKGLDTVKGLVI